MMNEFVHTIMTKNPICLNVKDNLGKVSQIFENSRIHHLPVVNDEGELVGLVTTYDLWKLNKSHESYSNVSVAEVMSRKIAKVNGDDKVGTAAELFLDKRIHALPVVSNNKLIGIVTSFDVLKYEFKKEYEKPILYKEVLEMA